MNCVLLSKNESTKWEAKLGRNTILELWQMTLSETDSRDVSCYQLATVKAVSHTSLKLRGVTSAGGKLTPVSHHQILGSINCQALFTEKKTHITSCRFLFKSQSSCSWNRPSRKKKIHHLFRCVFPPTCLQNGIHFGSRNCVCSFGFNTKNM